MNANTFAKLGYKNGSLVLELQREDDNPKTIYTDNTVERELEGVSKVLNFADLDHMLSQASLGDETTFDIERSFETELALDTNRLKAQLDKFLESIDKTLNHEVQDELIKNHINDLAASYCESVYESITFKLLSKVVDLALEEIKLDTDELARHPRLVALITQNAPAMDLKVTLI